MNKVVKRILIILTIVVGLTLLPTFTKQVNAALIPISNSGGTSVGGAASGGPTKNKTGYVVSMTWSATPQGTPQPLGQWALVRSQDAARTGQKIPIQLKSTIQSESKVPLQGANPYYAGDAEWPYPAFDGGNGVGYGKSVITWIKGDSANSNSRASLVAKKYCNVSTDMIQDHINKNHAVFINVQPVYWSNVFTNGSASSKKDELMVGLTAGVAKYIQKYNLDGVRDWTWRISKNGFPRSFFYDATYQGISVGSDPGSSYMFKSNEMMNKSLSWGICSLLANDPGNETVMEGAEATSYSGKQYQLVICLEDKNGNCTTSYGTCASRYKITDPYKGYDFVEADFSKKKTGATSRKATYAAVKSGCGQLRHISSPGTVQFQGQERALFLHYKQYDTIEIIQDIIPNYHYDKLYAWETSFIFGRYVADRTARTIVNNGVRLADCTVLKDGQWVSALDTAVKAAQEQVKSDEKEEHTCPYAGNCSIHFTAKTVKNDEVIIDGVSYETATGWSTDPYKGIYYITKHKSVGVDEDEDDFHYASWNLLNENVTPTTDTWDVYNNDFGESNKKWCMGKKVNPHFSYYLTRARLENLSVTPSRSSGDHNDSDTLAQNLAPKTQWEKNWVGKVGVTQPDNETRTHYNIGVYNYKYKAHVKVRIYYHYKHAKKTKDEEPDIATDGPGVGRHECEHAEHEWHDNLGQEDKIPKTGTHGANLITDDTDILVPIYDDDDIIVPIDDDDDILDVVADDRPDFPDSDHKDVTIEITPLEWNQNAGDHSADKFSAKVTDLGINKNAGKAIETTPQANELSGKMAKGESFRYKGCYGQLVASNFQGVQFHIYPEVPMTVWVSQSADRYVNPTEEVVYMMGERVRDFNPPIAHSFRVSLKNGDIMKGIGSLASAATGKDTRGISNPGALGVTAMGTTFEVATKNKYTIEIYTMGTTVNTAGTAGDANSAWHNTPTDVKASHDEYVASVVSGIRQEMIMKFEYSDGGPSIFYPLLVTDGDTKMDLVSSESTTIWWKKGHEENSDGLNKIHNEWCNQMWPYTRASDGKAGKDIVYDEAFQLTDKDDQILDTMFVNCNDTSDDNNSEPKNTVKYDRSNGTLYNNLGNSDHWYDEESQDKIKVEFYHTRVEFSYITADDKVDYNILNQSLGSRATDPDKNKTIHVRFYSRIYNINKETSADGHSWDFIGCDDKGTLRWDEIQNVDFTVLNQTTAQMKK